MKIKHLVLLPIVLLLYGCLSNPKSSSNQEQLPTTTGILIVSDGVNLATSYNPELRKWADREREYFKGILQPIEVVVNPTAELYEMYQETFEANGKQYLIIEENFSTDDFPKTFTYDKRYSRYDVSRVKEKYDIDELLFVKLDYGLWVGHFSDQGYCRIYSEIINLKNKKLRYRKPNTKRVALDGKWDEDTNYPHLKKAVKNAITLHEKNKA